jgi:hypothetical protein
MEGFAVKHLWRKAGGSSTRQSFDAFALGGKAMDRSEKSLPSGDQNPVKKPNGAIFH